MRFFSIVLILLTGLIGSAHAQSWREQTYRLRSAHDFWKADTILFEQEMQLYRIRQTLPQQGLFAGTSLQRSGSILRGFSLAGNSDPSTLSEFNMNLSGDLGNGLSLEAQISDKEMPLSPEGSTATLQDFDRIYIRLSHKKFAVQAGDVEMRSSDASSFLQFNRNVLGLSLELHHKGYTGVQSFGIAKGKFLRKSISVQSGVQGPYRLQTGEQQEQMQIISGSEKVYLNGELLKRGEGEDYTMNYAFAQLTFMSKRAIAANDRVEVEFEYTDRNYSRYLFSSGNRWDWQSGRDRKQVMLNFFSEQDAASEALNGSLSREAQQILEQAGERPGDLWVPSYDSVSYSVNEVLYARVDTLIGGRTYRIFVRSSDPLRARYRPRFSYLGAGKGNYVQLNEGSNGRVYTWIAPVQGVMQGSYDAVVPLTPPVQRQLLEGGFAWFRDSVLATEGRIAMSYYDGNTLSDQAADHWGLAGKWHLKGEQSGRAWVWNYDMAYWGQQKSFESADRFLPVEYALERSLSGGLEHRRFQSVKVGSGISGHALSLQLNTEFYEAGALDSVISAASGQNRTGAVNGMASNWKLRWIPGRWDMGTEGKYNPASNGNTYTTLTAWLIRNEKVVRYGLKAGNEDIRQDSVQQTQTRFIETFVSSPVALGKDAPRLSWQLKWSRTLENYGGLAQGRNDLNLLFSLPAHPAFQADINLNYRLRDKADSIRHARGELLMNGRLSTRLADGFISSQLAWGTSQGYEAKSEYYFVFVGPTKGTHAWKDYNGDGVQQLAEFEAARFNDEAEYVKVFAPSRSYVPVAMQTLNWGFGVQPSARWSSEKGWRAIMSCFSLQLNLVLDRKLRLDGNRAGAADLSAYALADTTLLSMNRQWSSGIFFRSPDMNWTAELTYRNQDNKYALSEGAEWSGKDTWNLMLAQRFLGQYKWKLSGAYARQQMVSQVYAQKNYVIREWSPTAGMEAQWGNAFRAEASYVYKHKQTEENTFERAVHHRFELSPAYYFPDQGMLRLMFTYVYADYPYAESSALAYEMLDGLRPGQNLQWECRFARKIWGGLEAELNYNGRRLAGGRILHAGTVSMRLNF